MEASIDADDYPVDYGRLREVVEVPTGIPVALKASETPEAPEPTPVPKTLYDRLELVFAEPGFMNQLSFGS